MMRKPKRAILGSYLAALVLELLPWGAVLRFANPDGEPWRRTFSYFSLVPFGYANVGPLLTAILTCILLVCGIILLFKETNKLWSAVRVISGAAVAASMLPFMFGLNAISVVGVLITVFLALGFGLFFTKKKEGQ